MLMKGERRDRAGSTSRDGGMGVVLRIADARAYRMQIPMRVRFEHAAATRDVADPVLVHVSAHAPFAHHAGWGETLARTYVTGESADSVMADLKQVFAPRLATFSASSLPQALEFIDALPFEHEGRVVHAARCAMELALLDLATRAFSRDVADVAGWLDLPGFGPPGCLPRARYSGIVLGSTRAKVRRWLRLQRWYGLRDFKLKVAVPGWEDRVRWAAEYLGPALRRGRATLRVDANAGWTLSEAHEACELLEKHGVCAVEQPLPEANDEDLPWLAEQSSCAIVADESLLSAADAKRLLEGGGVQVFNIRLAKHGGLLPSLRIARLVLQAGKDVQLGCLVGETSILAAAGAAFLRACPRVRFAEGAFGRFLLKKDVTTKPVRFGYGGHLTGSKESGFGLRVSSTEVDRRAIESLQLGRF